MSMVKTMVRGASVGLLALTLGACAQVGGLGDVLGGVLNSPGNQLSGTVQGVDSRNQVLFIRQSDGTSVSVQYDSRTQVVYQNQTYSVSSLENGDQVTARIQNNGNSYYTDYVQVDASVSGSTGNTGALYNLSGTVRQIDTSNGVFTLDTQNGGIITISMPYNPRTTDLNRFRSLRSGDYVSLQGAQLNQTRFELRQFYQ
ncbi:MAG TPA: hypothetical protein VF021_03680 [Longimicrobiales bacterium]